MLDKPVPPDTAVCGEVGLAGEIRAVANIELRIREAERLGFSRIIVPKTNFDRFKTRTQIDRVGVASIHEFLDNLNC
jgi:DNA repair protein RadA/Sms